MFGKNKREKLFSQLENVGNLSAYKINYICGKIYALAQKGDGEAYYKLYEFAKDNYKNHAVEMKYLDWLGLLKKAAEYEYPEAVCEYYARHGWGDAQNRIAMLEKVAATGYERACIDLADVYDAVYHGYAREDFEKLTKEECSRNIIKWLTVAAEKNNTDAQIRLGNFLSLYAGDLDGGIKWYTAAAEKDEAEAYLGLGRIYKKKEDWYKAQKYFKLAADKGNVFAICGLGETLLVPGVYQETERGLKLLCEAADKGNPIAAIKLAELYEKGGIVPQDFEKAKFWKNKSEEIRKAFLKNNDELEAKAEKDLSED